VKRLLTPANTASKKELEEQLALGQLQQLQGRRVVGGGSGDGVGLGGLGLDDVLVDGGSVLQAFGLRPAGDTDLLWCDAASGV
jgi:hypothetical protein